MIEKFILGLLDPKSLIHSENSVISVTLEGGQTSFYGFLVVFLAKNHKNL